MQDYPQGTGNLAIIAIFLFNPDFVPTDFKLEDNAVGFIPDNMPSTGLRQSRNLNSALSALEEGINQIQKAGHWKGEF